MSKFKKHVFWVTLLCLFFSSSFALPSGFVYLKDVDPTIIQDMRYAGYHNFIGHPINGYSAPECVLTKQAADALKKIQTQLKKSHYSLMVYDCYRPQRAVDEFISWSKKTSDQKMKAEFYPRVDKKDFFKLGYVAERSNHSHGGTMDLTIVKLPFEKIEKYHQGQRLVSCTASYQKRFHDGSIDMGTGFDCMDELSHPSSLAIKKTAYKNRMWLKRLMTEQGFVGIDTEWWHFTLKNQPNPNTYFNFPIA